MNFFALLLVGVFAIPAISLFSLALDSEAEVWGHLSSTVLPVYLGNSLILLLGVGMGTMVLGFQEQDSGSLCVVPKAG